jgi:hypothetical protein
MQFSASRSGANSGSGKDGWWRRMNSRLVIASMRVSRFSSAVSRVRRMSAGEKRLKISSVDSGSSQNWGRELVSAGLREEAVDLRMPSMDHRRGLSCFWRA